MKEKIFGKKSVHQTVMRNIKKSSLINKERGEEKRLSKQTTNKTNAFLENLAA